MVTYPIRVARNGYRGADPKKKIKANRENQIAHDLESKLNDLLLKQTAPVKVYLWHEISRVTGIPEDIVGRLGYSIDCGSNGFTAWRHDLSYEKAMSMI